MKHVKKSLIIFSALMFALFSISSALPAEAVDYTLQQVQTHNTASNCWTAINNKIYNLTSFISSHPGGSAAIISLCGTNGTAAFTTQHSGNSTAIATLNSYYIGDLTIADTTAPTAPTNLVATVISPSQINLAWTGSTDNVGISGYQIFRNTAQIATSTTATFNNTGLTASTTYSYLVRAFDAAGNISASSNTISATTLVSDTSAPSTPINLAATVISASQINLTWTASTDNVGISGYSISRNGTALATTTNTTFNNIGLTASTTYSYTVQAFDVAGNRSASSSAISATTLGVSSADTTAPSAPTNLTAHVTSYKHVNLKWTSSTDNIRVTGYAIFKNGVEIARVKKSHFNSIGLTASTTYTYTVRAFDAAGNMSANSNILTVTTLTRNGHKHHENEDEDEDEHDNDHWNNEKISKSWKNYLSDIKNTAAKKSKSNENKNRGQ